MLLPINHIQWEKAIVSGLVFPIPHSRSQFVDGPLEFVLFHASKEKNASSNSSSPFLHLSKEEKLAEWNGHNLIWNKFPIFPSHLLLTSKEFIPQTSDLDLEDFSVLYQVISASSGENWLSFYNCGIHSGASQMHKHIQLIPSIEDGIPIDRAIREGVKEIWCFNFWHWLEVGDFSSNGASTKAFNCYKGLLEKFRQTLGAGCSSYNFLLTKRWMLLVGRKCDSLPCKISINSLGFAGFLMERSSDELSFVQKRGFLQLLHDVTF